MNLEKRLLEEESNAKQKDKDYIIEQALKAADHVFSLMEENRYREGMKARFEIPLSEIDRFYDHSKLEYYDDDDVYYRFKKLVAMRLMHDNKLIAGHENEFMAISVQHVKSNNFDFSHCSDFQWLTGCNIGEYAISKLTQEDYEVIAGRCILEHGSLPYFNHRDRYIEDIQVSLYELVKDYLFFIKCSDIESYDFKVTLSDIGYYVFESFDLSWLRIYQKFNENVIGKIYLKKEKEEQENIDKKMEERSVKNTCSGIFTWINSRFRITSK